MPDRHQSGERIELRLITKGVDDAAPGEGIKDECGNAKRIDLFGPRVDITADSNPSRG